MARSLPAHLRTQGTHLDAFAAADAGSEPLRQAPRPVTSFFKCGLWLYLSRHTQPSPIPDRQPWASLLPPHLLWLGRALDSGVLASVYCFYCGRPLNRSLATVSPSAWRGEAYEWGDPEAGPYPIHTPPGGFRALPGAVPPHGRACLSAYHGEASLGAADNAWWLALRVLRLQETGDRPIWDGNRLRTELLPEFTLTLT